MRPRSIPFHQRFHDAVRTGRKTATARTKRYGHPGDLLRGPDCVIRLLEVRRVSLEFIAVNHFEDEGLDSPDAFRRVWGDLHPVRGYNPDQLVWLHRFEVVDKAGLPSTASQAVEAA